MTPSKPSPTPSLGSISNPSSSMPPDSSSVEPRSSRFTVVSVVFHVDQDGHRYAIDFTGVDAVMNYNGDTIIGVDSVRLAEALKLERDGVRGYK